jgi:hypothetical protein
VDVSVDVAVNVVVDVAVSVAVDVAVGVAVVGMQLPPLTDVPSGQVETQLVPLRYWFATQELHVLE